MLGVTLVPWAEGMRHRNSDDNVDITGAWSRNGEVRSPRGEDFNPETCKPGADRNTVSPGASSDHGADTQGPKEQNAMVSTLSRAFSGGKGDGAGEGPSKDGTGVPGVYMEKSVNLDSVSECQGTSENNGLERAVVAGIGKVPTFGTVFLIEDSCTITVKDTLTLSFGHKINFIPADCLLTTATSKELEKAGFIQREKLKQANPQLGQVIIYAENNRYVFNLVVKTTYDEKPYLKNIAEAISALRETMELLDVKTADISKTGNGLDQIRWHSIEETLRQEFGGSGITIRICTGQIEFPPVEERLKIIREYHNSAIGGHKGVAKTYKRIRNDFFWDGMKQEISDFVISCKDCQMNKLVRVKTRLPMKITDTPTEPFERIQEDIVGPLPITEKGNRYILTIQDNFSKYCEAIALSEIDSVTVARAFGEEFEIWLSSNNPH